MAHLGIDANAQLHARAVRECLGEMSKGELHIVTGTRRRHAHAEIDGRPLWNAMTRLANDDEMMMIISCSCAHLLKTMSPTCFAIAERNRNINYDEFSFFIWNGHSINCAVVKYLAFSTASIFCCVFARLKAKVRLWCVQSLITQHLVFTRRSSEHLLHLHFLSFQCNFYRTCCLCHSSS
jgi:hypothetical protein